MQWARNQAEDVLYIQSTSCSRRVGRQAVLAKVMQSRMAEAGIQAAATVPAHNAMALGKDSKRERPTWKGTWMIVAAAASDAGWTEVDTRGRVWQQRVDPG